MTLPNAITIARIALVPVFWVLAYARGDATAVASFAVFVVASLSDSLDGYLARRDGTSTRAGEFLDPLADKLLVGAALVVLVDLRDFPLWAALVIGAREVAVQVLRVSIVRDGGTLPASRVAKTKTAVQIGMVGWWLLPWETSAAHWLWLVAALLTTLWSGAEYFVRSRQTKEKVL
jgi:CDP-diacylglycerol---glycerol-3-phosphate 3-phosphatidyltransferase